MEPLASWPCEGGNPMYIVKGVLVGVVIFILGYLVLIIYGVIRAASKLQGGVAGGGMSCDIRAIISPTLWLTLLGLILLCTAFFRARIQ
jgi:hypothetical protein